jgi:C4-dicarboxylate-specific signal transduction histidine kinase
MGTDTRRRGIGPPISVVKDVLFVVDLLAHDKGGAEDELELSIQTTPFVAADRWVLRGILMNVFLAVRPPRPGVGKVRIEVLAEGSLAIVRAASHERTLAPGDLRRLQEALPVARESEKGLLVEAARLAAQNGGEVAIESERDRGTTVTIRLPLAATRPPRESCGPASKESAWGTSSPTSPCA